jgi:tRNA U34 5-methylaminomethyl-2-thiouridine-forming methyltransferase MnmC
VKTRAAFHGDSDPYEIVTLPNGAHSIHSHVHDETFHPVIGPQAEAEALYVRQLRLRDRLAEGSDPFVIWDVGLGAAANVLTALKSTRDLRRPLHVVSFDLTLEPLAFALEHADRLRYLADYTDAVARLLRAGSSRVSFADGARSVTWELHLGDFPAMLQEAKPERPWPAPHAIFYDPFSPARNASMWTLPLFERIFRHLNPQRPCALPTYSRSTLLRVTLLLAGFFVGAGHATGEKEETTIAANTSELIDEPLDRQWLGRAQRSTSAEPLCEGVYRQAPLSPASWKKLRRHPQFG